ncbi:MAG: DUF1570 domain-containing protein [Cytophagales bacterium]|nr:DUF1570 domain-containing protein [Cytophagales bacterium]
MGVSCVLLSVGATPASQNFFPQTTCKTHPHAAYVTPVKSSEPVVELLTHGCRLDPAMQRKIQRGVQFQYDFYQQYLGYEFSRDLVVRIRIFKNADTYRSFIDAHYPHIPKTWIGVYLAGVNEILVSLEKDEDAFYKNIFHETSHLLLTDKVKNCPNWLNEGLAEYFEFMTLGENEVNVELQTVKDNRIKHWQNNQKLPNLLTSISMTNKEWNFNDNVSESDEPRTLGWSVAYFLMSSSEGRNCIKNVLSHLAKHNSDAQASVRALNEHYPGGTRQLVQDWQNWIPQTHSPHAYLLTGQAASATASVVE